MIDLLPFFRIGQCEVFRPFKGAPSTIRPICLQVMGHGETTSALVQRPHDHHACPSRGAGQDRTPDGVRDDLLP